MHTFRLPSAVALTFALAGLPSLVCRADDPPPAAVAPLTAKMAKARQPQPAAPGAMSDEEALKKAATGPQRRRPS